MSCRNPIPMLRRTLFCLSLLILAACGEPVPQGDAGEARILMVGDSMLASNRATGAGVAGVIEAALGMPVVDRSVPGARYFHALPITGSAGLRLPAQVRPGDWDVIVVNGGGNDLLFGCGCGACSGVLDRLISEDGRSGAIPAFVQSLRQTGAHVVYSGYLRNPGTATPVKACGPAGNELDRRLAALDALDVGMTFLAMSDIVPYGDASYHGLDRIHPSRKGSRAIGLRIARTIGPWLGLPPG
jgi:acyl-CoA thioesterase I